MRIASHDRRAAERRAAWLSLVLATVALLGAPLSARGAPECAPGGSGSAGCAPDSAEAVSFAPPESDSPCGMSVCCCGPSEPAQPSEPAGDARDDGRPAVVPDANLACACGPAPAPAELPAPTMSTTRAQLAAELALSAIVARDLPPVPTASLQSARPDFVRRQGWSPPALAPREQHVVLTI